MRKIDYAVVIAIVTGVIGWGVSVESRLATQAEALNLSNRVRAMEELLLPMLIDWKTHKEMKKWQEENIKKISDEVDKSNPKTPKIAPMVAPVFNEDEVPPKIRDKVDNWAKEIVEKQAATKE